MRCFTISNTDWTNGAFPTPSKMIWNPACQETSHISKGSSNQSSTERLLGQKRKYSFLLMKIPLPRVSPTNR
ncbi:hypothetical protein UPYG_G00159380 [Umbra pygmaea]|uniref:Uncharacterized protein n=1 Tax=Umbra pygmaea TaxID=75934 RepID=A0ABD0WZ38_UMBPY